MTGDKILLDTNAFIYFFEGRSKITELVENTPEIYPFVPIYSETTPADKLE